MGHNDLNSARERQHGSPEAESLANRKYELFIAIRGVEGAVWKENDSVFHAVEQERSNALAAQEAQAAAEAETPPAAELSAMDASELARLAQAESDRVLANLPTSLPVMAATTALSGSLDPESRIDLHGPDGQFDPDYYSRIENTDLQEPAEAAPFPSAGSEELADAA